MNVKHQTWNDIEIRYQGLAINSEVKKSMLDFLAYISESEFSECLHPWTSMFELLITQTENHPFQDSVSFLQISPLNNGAAEFRYVDSNIKSKQWVRIADRGRLVERFESFVDQIGWRAKIL